MKTTSQADITREEKFDRLKSRIWFGGLSPIILFVSAAAFYVHFTETDKPQSIADAITSAFFAEFMLAMFFFSCLSLVWAIATPRWTERLWDRVTWKAILLLLLFLAGGVLCGLIWGS